MPIVARRPVVAASSGLALDESMLTGESDQVDRKERGDNVCLPGAYCRRRRRALSRVPAVGGDSLRPAKLTAEAREGRQTAPSRRSRLESTSCCGLLLVAMVPLAVILVGRAAACTKTVFREAAQTATAGLISVVGPGGSCCSRRVTFAAGAVRHRPRPDALAHSS